MQCGSNNRAVSLSSHSSLCSQNWFWTKLVSLTLHQPPGVWVTSWAVGCVSSLKHRCFFCKKALLSGYWGDQQIHQDWPSWYFLNTECFICLLLWSYDADTGIFSCTTVVLRFEEKTNAWINVDFLGLGLIVSKPPLWQWKLKLHYV